MESAISHLSSRVQCCDKLLASIVIRDAPLAAEQSKVEAPANGDAKRPVVPAINLFPRLLDYGLRKRGNCSRSGTSIRYIHYRPSGIRVLSTIASSAPNIPSNFVQMRRNSQAPSKRSIPLHNHKPHTPSLPFLGGARSRSVDAV